MMEREAEMPPTSSSNQDRLREKSWAGEYFGRDGALAIADRELERAQVCGTQTLIATLSSCSSTYYSAAGHALSQFNTNPLSWWGPRAARCLRRAHALSDEMFRVAGKDERNLTADQVDVRQSILRKVVAFRRRFFRWEDDRYHQELLQSAKTCISRALGDAKLAPHTRGLLLVGKVDIMLTLGEHENPNKDIGILLRQAKTIAEQVAEENPQQASRIYRGCADGFKRLGDEVLSTALAFRARELAESSGAADQVLKLKAGAF